MGYNILSMTILTTSVFLIGCGVKGRPLPPEKPSYIGRGQMPVQQPIKKEIKTKTTLPIDDFSDETDFPEDKDQ